MLCTLALSTFRRASPFELILDLDRTNRNPYLLCHLQPLPPSLLVRLPIFPLFYQSVDLFNEFPFSRLLVTMILMEFHFVNNSFCFWITQGFVEREKEVRMQLDAWKIILYMATRNETLSVSNLTMKAKHCRTFFIIFCTSFLRIIHHANYDKYYQSVFLSIFFMENYNYNILKSVWWNSEKSKARF